MVIAVKFSTNCQNCPRTGANTEPWWVSCYDYCASSVRISL